MDIEEKGTGDDNLTSMRNNDDVYQGRVLGVDF